MSLLSRIALFFRVLRLRWVVFALARDYKRGLKMLSKASQNADRAPP